MAVTAFSTVTHQILYQHGHIGPDTYRTVGTTIFPGAVVQINATGTKVVKISADNGVTTGVVGLLPNHDIDVAYAAGVAVPVYTVGCDAVVWCRFVNTTGNGSDAVAEQPLNHDGTTTPGCVFAAEGGEAEYVGVAYRDIDVDAANETPGLVQLI